MYTITEKVMIAVTAIIGALFLIQGIRLLMQASASATEKYHDLNTN